MKLADLKRLPVGTRLRLTHCLLGPVEPAKQWRTIRKVQTNAWASEPDWKPGTLSWLTFPKAADFRETADGFEVLEDGETAARYTFE